MTIDRVANRLLREWHTRPLRWSGRAEFVGEDRRQFFEAVLQRTREPVSYLEFGVWRGDGLRWWLEHLSPESRLFGFDSFQGLPEDWIAGHEKGRFSTGGQPPDIAAANLEFVVGWYEDTLAPWLEANRETLREKPPLVNVDCDLYAPAALVLETLRECWTPGTLVMFDEFWFRHDEYKALRDFCRRHRRHYRLVVVGEGQGRVAIEWQ